MPGRAGRYGTAVGRLAVGALALVLSACGGDAPEPPPGSGAAPEAGAGPPAPEAAPGPAEPGRHRGVLTLEGRPEVMLCDGATLPVDGPALPDLVELHAGMTPGAEPMEGIFVDVLGEVRDAGSGPWLDALEIRRASYEGWGCRRDEVGLVLEASGTEPFWNLRVEEETAAWSTPEATETLAHRGIYRMTRGGWALEGRTPAGEARLQAEFHPEPCINAMSGAFSHLTALVTLGGTEYRGCAYLGPEAEGGV